MAKPKSEKEQNLQYDGFCKSVLSYKDVLAQIMKHCVDECKDYDLDTIKNKFIEGEIFTSSEPVDAKTAKTIIGDNTEDGIIGEGTVHYDVRFQVRIPDEADQDQEKTIGLIINVEAQGKCNLKYSLVTRGIYYASRLISAQKDKIFKHDEYQKIKKVYSIWVCMNPDKNCENTITRYTVHEETLKGDTREPKENYDKISIIMLYLGDPNNAEKYDILRMLDLFFRPEALDENQREILEEEFEIEFNDEFESVVNNMNNVLEGTIERVGQKEFTNGKLEMLADLVRQGVITSKEAEAQAKRIKEHQPA